MLFQRQSHFRASNRADPTPDAVLKIDGRTFSFHAIRTPNALVPLYHITGDRA